MLCLRSLSSASTSPSPPCISCPLFLTSVSFLRPPQYIPPSSWYISLLSIPFFLSLCSLSLSLHSISCSFSLKHLISLFLSVGITASYIMEAFQPSQNDAIPCRQTEYTHTKGGREGGRGGKRERESIHLVDKSKQKERGGCRCRLIQTLTHMHTSTPQHTSKL